MSKLVSKNCINYIIPVFTGLYEISQLTEKYKSPLLSGGVSSDGATARSIMAMI